jgi:hypothetical protein
MEHSRCNQAAQVPLPDHASDEVLPVLITEDGAFMEPQGWQPGASGGKWSSCVNGGITPKPLPWAETGCREQRMVRVVSMRPPSC